jgi:hypothetical protein
MSMARTNPGLGYERAALNLANRTINELKAREGWDTPATQLP